MGLNSAQLAAAAGVKQPTSFNWGSGKTKNIKGEPLLSAARALGVTPEWLSTGKGPMLREATYEPSFQAIAHVASEPVRHLNVGIARATSLLEQLPEAALPEAILQLEWLLERHKKTSGATGHSDPVSKRKKK